jgi:fumarylpyruvate hydrolase
MPDRNFAIAPEPPVAITIRDSDKAFPVRRIYCVGRNYAEHTKEMGGDPNREVPFFFQKPADAADQSGRFPYPPATKDVHHEVELMVYLKSGGRDIPAEAALDCVFGYGVGLDMTRRDLQAEAKKAGRPWTTGKAFDRSAPCSDIAPVSQIGHPEHAEIKLARNGTVVQRSDLDQQIWRVPEVISYLSSLFELKAGDVIMTGTPAGVGPVSIGDELEARIEGVGHFKVKVTAA